jgi:hypothetical protein
MLHLSESFDRSHPFINCASMQQCGQTDVCDALTTKEIDRLQLTTSMTQC